MIFSILSEPTFIDHKRTASLYTYIFRAKTIIDPGGPGTYWIRFCLFVKQLLKTRLSPKKETPNTVHKSILHEGG